LIQQFLADGGSYIFAAVCELSAGRTLNNVVVSLQLEPFSISGDESNAHLPLLVHDLAQRLDHA
jgi:hypothetical protein